MSNTTVLRAGCLLGAVLGLTMVVATASAQRVYAPVWVGVHAYGYGHAPYPYGYTYNPRRAYRRALRYGYPPAVQFWRPAPSDFFGYPYPGYPYRGVYPYYGYPYYGYARPPLRHTPPVLASPAPQPPSASLGQVHSPPFEPIPEAIPTPPSEPVPQ